MGIQVGIDEAGYGPTLGPLVLGLSAFRGPWEQPVDLFEELASLVVRCGPEHDSSERIAVDDSKKLFAGRKTLAPMELGVLAFALPDRRMPGTLEELVQDEMRGAPSWYRVARRSREELPVEQDRDSVESARNRVSEFLDSRRIEPLTCRALPILEPRFNRQMRRSGNKAAAHQSFVADLLVEALEELPAEPLWIHVDRLGGRRYYHSYLASLLPFQQIRIVEETPHRSIYEMQHRQRPVRVSFETESDSRHLPVALASMMAKYVRELFLRRLNSHFAHRVPGLRPTAGYPGDASRFLDEIAGHLDQQDRQQLVRMA